MANFIELTNFDDGDVALINVDHVEFISSHHRDGTVLVAFDGRGKHGEDRFYHVRESYNLVKQLIRERHKSVPDSAFRFEMKEEYMSIVCDKICRFRDNAGDQDDLDRICENCPLVNFF